MSITEKLVGKVEINKDLILLLIVGGLYFLSIALSNTFVNVFLWKQSGVIRDIAFYNLAIVIMQPLTFILAGKWTKKIDRVVVLRLGVSFLSLFFLAVLFLGSRADHFLLLLGGLLGIGFGFFWLAFNVLTFEITEPETRDFFNGFLGLLSSLAGMIGPITAGIIITSMENFTGYKTIFFISLIFFVVTVILSFFLRRRSAHGKFSLAAIITERHHNPNWRRILGAQFFAGLREGTFAFVIVVWVFLTTKSELALGTFGLVQSGVSLFVYFLATRLIRQQDRKYAILLGSLVVYAAIFIILFHLSFPSLIFYAVVIAIAFPVLLVPFDSLIYDVIGKGWKAAEMRVEYIVVSELSFNAGRTLSILAFIMLVTFFDTQQSIRFLLGIIGAGYIASYACIRGIELRQPDPERGREKQPWRRLIDGENRSPI